MNKRTKAYIQVHIAVFLFGMTAILGGLISLNALNLVWWRVLLTAISLLFLTKCGTLAMKLGREKILAFGAIGVLMALHWLCFYGAIKLANASVSLLTMAMVALFTSFTEPYILKKKIDKKEVLMGLLVIPGMALIAQSLDYSLLSGFFIGILSALLAAVFSTLNKKYMDADTNVFAVTLVEMLAAWLILSLIIFGWVITGKNIENFMPQSVPDWIYLVFLAVICTTVAQALNLSGLKYLTTFTTNLVNNLEPVYGILLAAIILNEHEQLNTQFYIGSVLILITVMIFPMISNKSKTNP
jgi:drug/metabolite transporter (DMT)-like permease